MDFAFSDEQQMLREQARSFLAEQVPLDTVAELAGSDEGWDPDSFRAMAELGWTGLSVPEEHGGAGMGFIDEAVVFEELGRALYPGPYLSTVALALPALLEGGGDGVSGVAAGERTATLAWAEPSGPASLVDADRVTSKAERSNGAWTVTGEKHLVPDGAIVDDILVVAAASDGLGVWKVAGSDAEVKVASTMDRTRRLATVALTGTGAEIVVSPGAAGDVIEAIRLRALAATALEAVGVGQRALEMSIAHVKERRQFDKPIGAYQAVSHQVTDSYVELELARSLAYWAAWCVAEGDEQAPVAVAAAKSAAGDAAVAACERAIQVHGGIGFTWEHPLHLLYKRAQWIASFEGSAASQRAALASRLLA